MGRLAKRTTKCAIKREGWTAVQQLRYLRRTFNDRACSVLCILGSAYKVVPLIHERHIVSLFKFVDIL